MNETEKTGELDEPLEDDGEVAREQEPEVTPKPNIFDLATRRQWASYAAIAVVLTVLVTTFTLYVHAHPGQSCCPAAKQAHRAQEVLTE